MNYQSKQTSPLIAHVIYQLGVGGLENGLVNLINKIPPEKYRHAIICLTDSTEFKSRLNRNDVEIFHLNKQPGQDWMSFIRLCQLFRKIKPSLVHTRNLGTIEYQIPAIFAGVKNRVHGEHGWDIFDPNGENKKYQWVRRVLKIIIHRFIPLSKQLEKYLLEKIHVPGDKITRICNGVDISIFYPASKDKKQLPDCSFTFADHQIYIGTIGRMHGVKDQLTLVRAFIRILHDSPNLKSKVRLMVIGDGPLKAQAEQLLAEANLDEVSWLPGERSDIAEIMRHLDIFVLPSTAEGISNTVLEAMATGLPVIATDVGGNPELVQDGVTGYLTPKSEPELMAIRIMDYVNDKNKMREHGEKAHQSILTHFSMDKMVNNYLSVYDSFF